MGSKVEKHLSRMAMPKSWNLVRKSTKWVTRPNPGAHPMSMGIPLNIVLREMLGYAKTAIEVKRLLNTLEWLVDGKRRKDPKFIVGIMDIITVPKINKHYRMVLNKKGKLMTIEISESEAKIKPCKIKGKSQLKGKIHLNLYDGRNILVEKGEFKVGDTVLIEVPSQKIKDTIKLEKGNLIYLTGGKYIGDIGTVEDIKEDKIMFKIGNESVETSKRYAFVIGKEKPIVMIIKK